MFPALVGFAWVGVGCVAVAVIRSSDRSAALARVRGRATDEAPEIADDAPTGWSLVSAKEVSRALFGRSPGGRATRQELIVLIDELSSALTSGTSPAQAMTSASKLPGPLAAGLSRAVHQIHTGRGMQEVIDEWAGDHRDVGAVLVADGLALADSTGGSRTRALAGVRSTLREADGLAAEIRALAAQTRLSAIVLTLVPVGFAALVAVADARIASFLFATPLGWACLIGGGALDAAGAWWMHRLTGRFR